MGDGPLVVIQIGHVLGHAAWLAVDADHGGLLVTHFTRGLVTVSTLQKVVFSEFRGGSQSLVVLGGSSGRASLLVLLNRAE